MNRVVTTLMLATALFTGGCWSFPTSRLGFGDSRGGEGYTSGALTVSNGSQSGEMGHITGFGGDASRHSGYYDSYGANLRIDSEGSGWWVMSSLNVTGDLAGPAFAPGTHRTYTSAVYDGSESVSVTGCSGPEYGSYTYDHGSEEVTIDVSENADGSRHMHFEAVFTNDSGERQLTTGDLDYRITAGGSTTTATGVGPDTRGI